MRIIYTTWQYLCNSFGKNTVVKTMNSQDAIPIDQFHLQPFCHVFNNFAHTRYL